MPLDKYAYNETRYRMLLQSDEERAEELMRQAQANARASWEQYRHLLDVLEPEK